MQAGKAKRYTFRLHRKRLFKRQVFRNLLLLRTSKACCARVWVTPGYLSPKRRFLRPTIPSVQPEFHLAGWAQMLLEPVPQAV